MSARATYRFARVPEWIIDHADLEAIDVRVFARLDRYDGRDCIPSMGAIATKLGCSEQTVRRAIRRLEKVGAVVVEQRTPDGRQTSNRYHLAGDSPLAGRPTTGDSPAPTTGDSPAPTTDGRADLEQEEREQEEPETTLALVAQPDHKLPTNSDRAREICRHVWDTREPKPAGSFIGVAKIVERLLNAGHQAEAVQAAAMVAPTLTVAALELQLNRRASGAPAPVAMRRDLSSGTLDL